MLPETRSGRSPPLKKSSVFGTVAAKRLPLLYAFTRASCQPPKILAGGAVRQELVPLAERNLVQQVGAALHGEARDRAQGVRILGRVVVVTSLNSSTASTDGRAF